MKAQTLYCIPGLGVDRGIFSRLQVPGWEVRVLEWIPPARGESMASYALRMMEQIPEPEPVLLGLSFGGMLAVEMARQRPVKRVVLVSSVPTMAGLPRWMRTIGRLRLHRLVPLRLARLFSGLNNRRVGIRTPEERVMVAGYRRNADLRQVGWSVDVILRWRNTWTPANLVHIHGTDDRIFPIGNCRPTHTIEGGTHLMIFNRAEEVAWALRKILGAG